MTDEFIYGNQLDELTNEYLNNIKYRNVFEFLDWPDRIDEAQAFGLNQNQINELRKYLNKLGEPIHEVIINNFIHWLTDDQLNRLESLKKEHPNTWEEIANNLLWDEQL